MQARCNVSANLRRCRRWCASIAAACALAGCASASHFDLAHVALHPIASPRVPFYRYDATRVVEVEYIERGTAVARYWLADRARGIDSLISDRAVPACRFDAPAWLTMFNVFEARLPQPVELRPHYASDDPDVLVFARAVPTVFRAPGADLDAFRLDTLASFDGGRTFVQRNVLLNPAPQSHPDARHADYSDIPMRVTQFSKLHFLIVRAGVVYAGFEGITPRVEVAPPRSTRQHLGQRIAVFAYAVRDADPLPRARLLHGAELSSLALPAFDAGTHATDAALLARARPPGPVGYDTTQRRTYVEALRAQFPQWAAQQRIDLGRDRYLTTDERLAYVEAARKRGDPCAQWAVE